MTGPQYRALLEQLREGTGYERIQLERLLAILVEIGDEAQIDLGDIPDIFTAIQDVLGERSRYAPRTRWRRPPRDRYPHE